MRKNFTILMVAIVFLFLSFAFSSSQLSPAKKHINKKKLTRISKNKYILRDGLFNHNLTNIVTESGQNGVIDTLFWYDEVFAPIPGNFADPGDTIIQTFQLLPDPARLIKVRGIFGSAGQADFYIWKSRETSFFHIPVADSMLANLQWNVQGSTNWEELDFTDSGTDTLELPYSPDPDPANRPWFAIGYIAGGTVGAFTPQIYLDMNDGSQFYFTGSELSTRSYWLSPQDNLIHFVTYGPPVLQFVFEVVVNFYNGTSPMVNAVSQLNDTWSTSGFKQVVAEIVDIDGVVAEEWMFYQKNSEAPDSVRATAVEENYYAFDIPGTYAAGDTITYWIEVTDNDDKSAISAKKSFLVLGPQYPTAPILVVFNGLLGEEANLDTFWTPLLNAVIQDSMEAQYETWDVDSHMGIDKSVIDYTSFKHALCLGFSMNAVPVEEYGLWEEFVKAGNNILVASNDYLFEQTESNVELTFVEGDFIYDIFGVGTAINDPADNDGFSIGDQFLIGIDGDPISENWYGNPLIFNFIPLLDTLNWNDYASAASGLSNAATVFLGVLSGKGNGTRNVSTYGGKGVYLPFNLSALVDTTGGTFTILDDANQLLNNILEWFSEPTGIDDDPYTQIYSYELKANYPNPFNPITTIEYSLRDRSQVILIIYNALGEKVKTLVNDMQSPRKYQIKWDGTNDVGNPVSSGVYIYKLTAGDFTKAHKMILMK